MSVNAVQLEVVDGHTYAFCGFTMSREVKDVLLARWAAEYPELDEGGVKGSVHVCGT